MSFDSTHISDVVAGFASFSGRSIIVGEGIDLVIRSTQIIDQPWDVAFNEILMANGLRGVEQASGVIMVQAPNFEAARDSLEPKRTVVYSVNYKSAPSLAPVLAAVVESRGGSVIADSSSNSLIITDARNRIEEDTLLLVSLDRPTAQVTIQAKLVFVDRTDIEALGVRYDLGDRGTFFNELVQRPDPGSAEGVDVDGDGTTDFTSFETYDPETKIIDLSGNSLAAIGNASGFIANPALELIFSTAVGNFDLTMFVEALQEFQLADLQAEPLIQTADNTPASILVGERTPVRVIDAGSQGGQQGGQQPRATVQFEETGIRLDVTPHVTNTNQVLMTIHAENSSVRVEAAVDLGFTFQTQEADNQILVNDGETAVIGGLTVTEVTVTKQGLPLLSDLPIIGNLFGFTRREEQRRDLLILVTPRVIQPLATN